MATRSNIGYVDGDKIVRIYHHWDGYPEFLGRRLLESYNSEEAARALIAGGDISTLGKSGHAPRYYAKRGSWDPQGWSQDEPWEDVKPQTLPAAEGRECTEEYLYLWEDGAWTVTGDDGTRNLADVIAEIDAQA